jgi:Zn-dependent protease with chaperone function
MSTLASLQFFLLAALLLGISASVVASLALPLVVRSHKNSPPDARCRMLLLLAISPVTATVAGMAAAVAPSLLGLVWPAYDHCLAHGGRHAHLCFVHLPHESGGPLSWLVLASASGFLGSRATTGILGLRRAARVCSRLLAHGAPEPRLEATILPTASPLCLSVGILRPETVLSEGFLLAVDDEQLQAVLVHERAHATRRDALARAVAVAATVLMLPGARARLLEELELAAEQSCDEAAARAIGDRLTMAEVILRVERLISAPRGIGAFAVSFGGTAIPLRVAALVGPPPTERRGSLATIMGVCGFLAFAAASDHLHHAVETLVGFLVH